MAGGYFTFVGAPVFSKKNDLVKELTGTKGVSMSFGVKAGNDIGNVEIVGFPNRDILTYDIDRNKVEVAWADRLNPDVIDSVASYRKFTVRLADQTKIDEMREAVDTADESGDENVDKIKAKYDEFRAKELEKNADFITEWDMIKFLEKYIKDVDGNIRVRGQFRLQTGKNGKTYQRFNINGVYLASEEEKPRLSLQLDLYYNRGSVDDSDVKESGKIYLNSYVQSYINKDVGNKFMPLQTVFNTSVYKADNERHQKLYAHKMKYIDIAAKTMHHILWDCVVVNGPETIEWDESMLTQDQREQIEFGIRTVDDFRPKNKIFGNRTSEIRLFEPVLTGDFADGMVDSGMTNREFEDEIFTPVVVEDIDEKAKPKVESKVKVEEEDDSNMF